MGLLSLCLQSSVPLVTDEYYPLTDESQMCDMADISKSRGVKLLDYTCLKPVTNETLLLSAIYHHGPVIASVDAVTWNEYMGGIIQYHCGTALNHAVQIVGYDLTGKVTMWL